MTSRSGCRPGPAARRTRSAVGNRPLAEDATAAVPGVPVVPVVPFTASFAGAPAEHDGDTRVQGEVPSEPRARDPVELRDGAGFPIRRDQRPDRQGPAPDAAQEPELGADRRARRRGRRDAEAEGDDLVQRIAGGVRRGRSNARGRGCRQRCAGR